MSAEPLALEPGARRPRRRARAGGCRATTSASWPSCSEHLGELAFHTAESLAQGAGVSAAAVVRFSRRLGFASFRELRDRARDELQADARRARPAARPSHARPQGRARHRQPRGAAAAARGAARPAAAGAIAGARTTWLLANRETYGLAVYAQRLLHQVREDVRLVDPSFADPLRVDRRRGRRGRVHVPAVRAADARLVAPRARARARGSWSSPTAAHTTSSSRPTSCSPCPSRARRCCCRSRPAVCVLEALVAQRGDARRRPHARDAGGDGGVRGRAGPGRRAPLIDRRRGGASVSASSARRALAAIEAGAEVNAFTEVLRAALPARATRAARGRARRRAGRGQGHALDGGRCGRRAARARSRTSSADEDAVAVRAAARGGRGDRRPDDQPRAVLPRRHASPRCSASRATRTTSAARRAARAAAPAPRSPTAPCRWPSAPTAAARSASPPRSAASSATSRRSASCP